MAQIKLLKIGTDGVPLEFDSANDEITLSSFTAGAGPVMSATGIDMNNTDLSEVQDLSFNDPSTGTINQTAGALIVDDIMAKERNNVMATSGAILFPSIADSASEVDSFKIPHISGAPTATPAFSSAAGYMVYDDTNNDLYVWDGAGWDNLNVVEEAERIVNLYTAEVAVAARDVVYISSADNVSPAQSDAIATSYAIGLAKASALLGGDVSVVSEGIVDGFTGLTAGAQYYLSAATAGAITSTVPNGSGNTIVRVGFAKSATALHLQLQSLGRRA